MRLIRQFPQELFSNYKYIHNQWCGNVKGIHYFVRINDDMKHLDKIMCVAITSIPTGSLMKWWFIHDGKVAFFSVTCHTKANRWAGRQWHVINETGGHAPMGRYGCSCSFSLEACFALAAVGFQWPSWSVCNHYLILIREYSEAKHKQTKIIRMWWHSGSNGGTN